MRSIRNIEHTVKHSFIFMGFSIIISLATILGIFLFEWGQSIEMIQDLPEFVKDSWSDYKEGLV